MNYQNFIYFDWVSYINNNDDLLQSGMKTKKDAWLHWIHHGKKEGRTFYTLLEEVNQLDSDSQNTGIDDTTNTTNTSTSNTNEESYHNFDWKSYLGNYLDLSSIKTKDHAFQHWINHGRKEGRQFYGMTNEFGNNDVNDDFNNFDWETYLNNYEDLIKSGIKTKEHAFKHWMQHGKQEGRQIHNIMSEEMEKFDWKTYLNTYGDLSLTGVATKEDAWNHWINYGKKEERTPEYKNTTKIHCARFGNLFFLNMLGHFVSVHNNLKMEYKYEKKFNELGIEFYSGEKTYDEDFTLTDKNFMNFIYENNQTPIEKNIVFTNEMWGHDSDFCFLLDEYFKNTNVRDKIMSTNLFKSRYNKNNKVNNNDLYVHVRLDDAKDKYNHLTFEYYDKILSQISFDKGYISSDTIKDDICKQLIRKYRLNTIYDSDIHTLMFGSTCRHIVLSGGTYSWLIGFLGFFSDVYCPAKRRDVWYGDIFVFPTWKKIESADSIEIKDTGETIVDLKKEKTIKQENIEKEQNIMKSEIKNNVQNVQNVQNNIQIKSKNKKKYKNKKKIS